ncbi:thyroid transcription factor 1-associated protein 26 isoform X1 [Monodelphis domestica]|uniref:Coiled-coil domain containing 59 n=1 Tax=Monodelphis domestica TaxID=13616 RepID=F6UNX3_MONDO|nr:thyroid transcription factor 1-associated protein 26 isoform X1 [Monodelphis domestica]
MAPAKRSRVVRPRGARIGGAQPQGGPAGSPEFKKKKKKLQKQRMWRANTQKAFSGSVREGQGFAFQRKQKIQQEYKKLLRKEKKAQISQESQFTEKYPEHLKHLYLAEEEEMLRKQDKKEKQPLPEEKSSVSMNPVATPRRNKKKTSNQKAKEEYEKVQAKRAAKKQEFEKRKQEREEAQQRYKKKKMEAYKILSKKTKKGQPNLNLQMEYLLKKIQERT